jgi:hypothetical protein
MASRTSSNETNTVTTSKSSENLKEKDIMPIEEAVKRLKESVNLYEQMDLLHYIFLIKGKDYEPPNLATVESLLEEIYFKTTTMHLWTIVRASSGLLRKVVNSLSINIADLLIQQKHVSIGYGNKERYISEPLPPEAITQLIYITCTDDIREASLIQEIVTFLGSFLRADPSIFNGILRVRTHYIIVAIRDEICRQKNYSEYEGYEYLMTLSPFEIKGILKRVLTMNIVDEGSRSSKKTNSMSNMHFESEDEKFSAEDLNGSKIASEANVSDSWFGPLRDVISITVRSAGYLDGNYCKIELNSVPIVELGERGINLVVIDSKDGTIIQNSSFDTHISEEESEELIKTLQYISEEDIVILCVRDDASERLSLKARTLIKQTFNSQKIQFLNYRDSWCMIGKKNSSSEFLVEEYSSQTNGPTKAINKIIPLGRSIQTIPFGPNKGRWFQKRKNDGALNRVPARFYPKVWNVLEKCCGIIMGNRYLPRDPTVFEKTAEEFNFALQVESVLDGYIDPAERQVAVECLMVVAKINERNSEINIQNDKLNVDKIIRDAIKLFWGTISQNPAICNLIMMISNNSIDFHVEKIVVPHGRSQVARAKSFASLEVESVVRKVFFDLARHGAESTTSYLTKSIIQNIPLNITTNESCITS